MKSHITTCIPSRGARKCLSRDCSVRTGLQWCNTCFGDDLTLILSRNFRTFLAFLSMCGFFLCVAAYVESFLKSDLGTSFGWLAVVLVLGAMTLVAPIWFLEDLGYRLPFLWKSLPGMPSWVHRCSSLLSFVVLGHFAWLFAHAIGAKPEIGGGQDVWSADGQAGHIAPTAVRVFATVMISIYFASMTYWWFRRDSGNTLKGL